MQKDISHDQDGFALLLTIILLLLLSALGIHALARAQDENLSAGASRSYVRNIAAADAGIKIALAQLQSSAGLAVNTDSIRVDEFYTNAPGLASKIYSGARDSSSAQPIEFIQYVADAGSGSQLNLGSGQGGGGQVAIYRVNIVAQDPGGGVAQVQAQLAVQAPSLGY